MVSGMKTDLIIADLFYAILCITLSFFCFTVLFFGQCGSSITDVNIHSTLVFLRVDCVHVKLKPRFWLLRSTMCRTLFFFGFIMFSPISSVNSLQASRWKTCICEFRAHFLQSKGYSSDRKET